MAPAVAPIKGLLGHWRSLLLLGVSTMACFYVYSILASQVSNLMERLDLSHTTVGLLQILFCVGSTGPVFFAGRLADYKNTQRLGIFLGMCVFLGTGLAIVGIATNHLYIGIASGRFICGFAVEALVVVIMTVLSSTLPASCVPLGLGINLSAGRFGSVLAHLSGAWIGTGATAVWNGAVVTTLAGAICALSLFLYFRVSEAPAIEQAFQSIHRQQMKGLPREFWNATVAAAAFYGAYYAFEMFSQHFLREAIHLNPRTASYSTGLMLVASASTAPLFARFADTVRRRRILMSAGALGLAVGLIALSLGTPSTTSPVFAGVAVVGLSMAAFPAAFWPHISALTPKAVRGSALATVTIVQQIATAACIYLFAFAADHLLEHDGSAITICVAFAIISVVLVLLDRNVASPRREAN